MTRDEALRLKIGIVVGALIILLKLLIVVNGQ